MQQANDKGFAAVAYATAASLLLGACSGNGAGLDANGQPLAPGGQGPGPLTAEFSSIQAQVFTPICTVCHAGAGAPQGLRLDAADSYNLLVGVPSAEVPSVLRVRGGDPNNSYIIQKIEGHAAVGARMPLGGPYLSVDVVAVIRQWITAGALPVAANAAPASFAIVSVTPAAGDVLTEPPAQIMIGFNHELDVNRIDSESVRIEQESGEDSDVPAQVLPMRTVVPARATMPLANPRALLLWPGHTLGAGHYRVVMRIENPLTDIAGQSIRATSSGETLVTAFDLEETP